MSTRAIVVAAAVLGACAGKQHADANAFPRTAIPGPAATEVPEPPPSDVAPNPANPPAGEPVVPEPTIAEPEDASGSPKIESASSGPDALTFGDIEPVIRAAKAKHKACFMEGFHKFPDMSTRVRIRLEITGEGNVKNPRVVEPATGEKPLPASVQTCVRGVASKLVFRKTGSPLTIIYPMHFTKP